MKPLITCQDVTEQVTEHMEETQSWSEWLAFRVHILLCKDCRTYLAQMQKTVETLSRMPGEPFPDEVNDELMKIYRDWKAQR